MTTSTKISALYPSCDSHSSCPGKEQFCGIQCWTGGCGVNGRAPRGTVRQFCQPCDECQSDGDSVTGSCSICNFEGTMDSVLRVESPFNAYTVCVMPANVNNSTLSSCLQTLISPLFYSRSCRLLQFGLRLYAWSLLHKQKNVYEIPWRIL